MITKYENYCVICGTPAVNVHHLCFGKGLRDLSEKHSLTAPLCFKCHEALHHGKESKLTQEMSRIIGQLEYEKHKCADGHSEEEAREMFRKEFGISYL